MVEGGMKCVKYLLFAFNIIFVIAGIALIVCGALVQTEFKKYFDVFGEQFNGAAILLIVVGCIVFFIAAFGCFGAFKENYICTMVFAGLLTTIFILEIAGGIAGFILRNKIKSVITDKLDGRLNDYNVTESTTNMFNSLQHEFHCCGVSNYSDWQRTSYYSRYGYPTSCCLRNTTCNVPVTFNNIYHIGCVQGFSNWAMDNIYKIGAAGIALAFIQIIGIIFACCLARSIRKEYEVV